jgi:hypothetical protein
MRGMFKSSNTSEGFGSSLNRYQPFDSAIRVAALQTRGNFPR